MERWQRGSENVGQIVRPIQMSGHVARKGFDHKQIKINLSSVKA